MSEDTFNKLTAAICEKHENIIQEVCQVQLVKDLKDFYGVYAQEEKALAEKYDKQSDATPTIETIGTTFQKLEEYPSNLQRSKSPLPITRLNSTISRSSPTLNDSTIATGNSGNLKEASVSLLNLNRSDDVPTAAETLNNFTKFQKHLNQLKAEIIQQDVEKEYANKLKQLSTFAQQLEKLLPTEKVGKSALTPEEENIIEDMVNRMDDMNFVQSHQHVFHQNIDLINTGVASKLDNLADILSYCLLAINSFNMN